MRLASRALFVWGTLIITQAIAVGQIKMEGFLRVDERVDTYTQRTLDRGYYVEVYADRAYKADTVPIATLLQDGEPISELVTAFPSDRIRFRMILPAQADLTKTYNVYVTAYEDETGHRYGRLVGVKLDVERAIFSDSSCRLGLGLNYRDKSGTDAPESLRYKGARISRVYDWAQKLTQAELNQIILRTEPLTRLGTKTLTVQRVKLNVA